jgi:glycosyltransferase involved in cell wall biosynthesis
MRKIVYVSYDGALDPLGSSQIVPYLEGLSRSGYGFRLISFEKPDRLRGGRRRDMEERLRESGIEWAPLTYHRSPRVPATLWDVLCGARAIRNAGRAGPDLMHVRGEVPAIMARVARLRSPLLLDMRGFWSDERVDAGSWRAGSTLDRLIRDQERRNRSVADHIVVLTRAAERILAERGVRTPCTVIPTCVDTARFIPRVSPELPMYDLVYFGSLGGWYMTAEMIEFVRIARIESPKFRALFLVNTVAAPMAREIEAAGADVRTADPRDMPGWLGRCRASMFFIQPTFSKLASCPTKLAESLAMGLPVIALSGVGDVDSFLTHDRVGVALASTTPETLRAGWRQLTALMVDPETPARCRRLAESSLSLEVGVARYRIVYDQLLRSPGRGARPAPALVENAAITSPAG